MKVKDVCMTFKYVLEEDYDRAVALFFEEDERGRAMREVSVIDAAGLEDARHAYMHRRELPAIPCWDREVKSVLYDEDEGTLYLLLMD